MSLTTEESEIIGIVNRLLDNLALTATSRIGFDLRKQIGKVRANYMAYLADDTFTAELLACFTIARTVKVGLLELAAVRLGLFNEQPEGEIAHGVVQAAISFCLSTEAQLITDIEFTSRDDVDLTIKTMKVAFDTAREMAADALDSSAYQTLTYLAGALTAHLANTSRPLPRMVTIKVSNILPALTLSNVVYHTAERWEEIVLENKIIHPAFCPIEIRGLSS